MPTPVEIVIDDLTIDAELDDGECAKKIVERLPVQGSANIWGEEIYFRIGLNAPADQTARRSFAFGEMAYGPASDGICLFFGPTPISGPDESCPANPCNPIGRMTGDYAQLRQVGSGQTVVVRAKNA